MHPEDEGNEAPRIQLLAQGGIIAQSGRRGTLMKDATFIIPAAAARLAYGDSINGRLSLQDLSGQSIKVVWGQR